MASYREHMGFSGLFGVCYGIGTAFAFDFTPSQCALAGYLTAVGGMLPDIDSQTGKPVQEIFSFTAAVVPLVLVGRFIRSTGIDPNTETTMLVLLGLYLTIRYGFAWLIGKLSVHRGMFHSIPAMIIAGEAVYLGFPNDLTTVKLLMGFGIALGFLSHLLLDEIYAVQWSGLIPRFKKSFGTAMKFSSKNYPATCFTYMLFVVLSFFMFQDAGLIGPLKIQENPPMAEDFGPAHSDPSANPFPGSPIPPNGYPTSPSYPDSPMSPGYASPEVIAPFPADEVLPHHLKPVTKVQSAAVPEEELTDAPLYR